MKILRRIGLFILCAGALAFTGQPPATRFVLLWNYPMNAISGELRFNLYSTTNVSSPLTSWPLFASVSASDSFISTDGTNGLFGITNSVLPQAHFFFVTASNFWGESVPSNVATSSPALSPLSNTLKIQKAP